MKQPARNKEGIKIPRGRREDNKEIGLKNKKEEINLILLLKYLNHIVS